MSELKKYIPNVQICVLLSKKKEYHWSNVYYLFGPTKAGLRIKHYASDEEMAQRIVNRIFR